MSLSGSEQSLRSERLRGRRKLFRKRDRRSRSSERYEFSDVEDDVFLRGPRKLRREDVEGELSYDYNLPGRLKVFTAGLNHTGGVPEFKTVLVASQATSADVISSVLERCEILYEDGDEFFLCEVIGKLEPVNSSSRAAAHFVEQCRRIIGPNEHVLVIQALWKPLFGYFRRFELKQVCRRQSRARRPARLTAGRPRSSLLNGDSGVCSDSADFFRAYDLDADDSAKRPSTRPVGTQCEPQCRRAAACQTESVYFASPDRRLRKKYSVPLGPFLLLLKGFDSRHDLLVNDLYDTNVLGSDESRCDIHLRCADVLPEHCVIETCHSESDGSRPYCMTVAAVGHAEVLLNGKLVVGRQRLLPGDVLSVGASEMRSYAFVFKDSSQVPDRTVGLGWLDFLEAAQRSRDDGPFGRYAESPLSFASTSVPSDSVLGSPRPEPDAQARQFARGSLRAVLTFYFGEAIDLSFSAGLLALLVTYAADLGLSEAESEIQWQISDAILTLCKKSTQVEILEEKMACFTEMIRACSLAFEMFLFFHRGRAAVPSESCRRWREFCESVMQRMLDCVFDQLGETAVSGSVALFDFGSSAVVSSADCVGMDAFVGFLTRVNQSMSGTGFHCVETLRQMIMKRLVFLVAKSFALRLTHQDSKDFLRWTRAVQLRINLDQLEEWLRQDALEIFLPALALPNNLVDLLATPKSQLCTMSWATLRNAYPELPPSVLLRVLTDYDGGCGPVQTLWTVARDDMDEASYDASCSLEDYFQLAIENCEIPVEEAESSVHLESLLEDREFKELVLHLDQQTAGADCHLQWRRVARHVQRLLSGESRRPQTPTPADPFKSLGADVGSDGDSRATPLGAEFAADDSVQESPKADENEDSVSLMDSRTLANTIRNEIHAHRVTSETLDDNDDDDSVRAVSEFGSDVFSDAASLQSGAMASGRPSCPLSFHGNWESAEGVERLYEWRQQQPRPPAPPPRSDSLASSRCSRVTLDGESTDRQSSPEEPQAGQVFQVTLTRSPGQSFGLELVDGRKTSLAAAGVYVRAVRLKSPAAACGLISPGCRILAVNNHSVMGRSYSRCVSLIKESQDVLQLSVANTNGMVAMQVLTSSC